MLLTINKVWYILYHTKLNNFVRRVFTRIKTIYSFLTDAEKGVKKGDHYV